MTSCELYLIVVNSFYFIHLLILLPTFIEHVLHIKHSSGTGDAVVSQRQRPSFYHGRHFLFQRYIIMAQVKGV